MKQTPDLSKQRPNPLITEQERKLKRQQRLRQAQQKPELSGKFIQATYMNLAMAMLVLVGIEYLLFQAGFAAWYSSFVKSYRDAGIWVPLLIAFTLVSRFARRWIIGFARTTARASTNRTTQYLIFLAFILLKAVLLAPLLWHASQTAPGLIASSALITLALVAGISVYVLTTKSDFSFLKGFVRVGGFLLIGIVVARLLFGFQLGWIFALAIAIYALIRILYRTSSLLKIYQEDQAIVAALDLFASVTMLFASILRLQRQLRR